MDACIPLNFMVLDMLCIALCYSATDGLFFRNVSAVVSLAGGNSKFLFPGTFPRK
jgi:hypothetical protein